MRLRLRPQVCALAVIAIAMAGCESANRTATLNDTGHIAGARAAAAVQAELARRGLSHAVVTCAREIIVYVGPATTCHFTGTGLQGTVRFTFKTLDGVIDPASVTVEV